MDKLDADLMNERAEDLDELFTKAEKGLVHCTIHPDQVVYLDRGCGACRWLENLAAMVKKDHERVMRRRKRR